jgi:hypothetical protein
VLGILGLVALYLVYTNVLSGPPAAPGSTEARTGTTPTPGAAIPTPGDDERPAAKRSPAVRGRTDEFRPVLRSKRKEDRPDPAKIDPTLRLDLLAKVQEVAPAGGTRSLFQFAPPPPKETEKPKGEEPKVFVAIGPRQPPPPPPPAPPPVLVIPLKFYGYSTILDNGKKTAYFLDGEDILLAAEGDTLKRRYKVVRIGPNSVLMEDTESKRQQTVPLAEEAQS